MAQRREGPCRVAIAGASTLRGKELKQTLEDRKFPVTDFVLLDESLPAGTLAEAGGEPTFIRALDEESFSGVRFAFFAGSADEAVHGWKSARQAGATVIDLTGGLAKLPNAFAWIPSLSRLLPPSGSAQPEFAPAQAVYSSPVPGAMIAASLVAALHSLSPSRVVLQLFLPVSEQGQAGIDELESQTADLLSFRPVSKRIFDAQAAFNLLYAYGEASPSKLEEIRSGIADATARYLAGRVPVPAMQIVQAPVFHGYTFSAYAEFAAPKDPQEIEAAVADAGMKVTDGGEAPNAVNVAGEDAIQLARVSRDSNVSTGMWLWGAADNLRLAASNAVQIAEELLVAPA
jgi:aspartate-semialdehyde dehydrogenase